MEEWQDQTATTVAVAKQKARAEKRMRQKANKVERTQIRPTSNSAKSIWETFAQHRSSGRSSIMMKTRETLCLSSVVAFRFQTTYSKSSNWNSSRTIAGDFGFNHVNTLQPA